MVKLAELFKIFFQIGAFTLGGGYAMLSMVEISIVEKKRYLTKDEFWDLIAVVQTLPGVFAVNTALYVGYKLRGKLGAFCSAMGAALPSFIAIILIAIFFKEIKDNQVVESAFRGIRPCVVALILVPAVKLMKQTCSLKTIWIPLSVAFVIWMFKVSPILIVLLVFLLVFAQMFVTYLKMRK